MNEDGTHHQTKHLHKEDYLPIGSIINMDGRKYRIDGVDFDKGKVSLQDMALADLRMPLFREEPLALVRELYEQEQEVMENPLPDYKVGDNAIVDLPTRTIEGKIGYAETEKTAELMDNVSKLYEELISFSDLYDSASFEAKKMIVNQLIRRVDVYRGYQLNITFNFDLTPYIEGE